MATRRVVETPKKEQIRRQQTDTSEQKMLQLPNKVQNFIQCHIFGVVAKVVKNDILTELDHQPDKIKPINNTAEQQNRPQNEKIMEIKDCTHEVKEELEFEDSGFHIDGVSVKEEIIDVKENMDLLGLRENINENKWDLLEKCRKIIPIKTESQPELLITKDEIKMVSKDTEISPIVCLQKQPKHTTQGIETSEEARIRRKKLAEYVAARRAAETPEEKRIRRQKQAEYAAARRAAEPPEKTQIRRLQQTRHKAMQRAAETPEQKQIRRQKHAAYVAAHRAAQTLEEKRIWRQQQARYKAIQRAAETPEEKQVRRQKQAEYVAALRAAEIREGKGIRQQKKAAHRRLCDKREALTRTKEHTSGQKLQLPNIKLEEGTTDNKQDSDTGAVTIKKETMYVKEERKSLHLEEDVDNKQFEKIEEVFHPELLITKHEECSVATRSTETSDQVQVRLQKQREYSAIRRATETPEKYEVRLKKHREYLAAKRTTETPEEYQIRLKKQSEYLAARRAAETPEARRVRLQKHREYLAIKTEELKSDNLYL